MGILVGQDYSGLIDRVKRPVEWNRMLVAYIDLCAASGRAARAGDVERARYLGNAARSVQERLW